MKIDIEGRKYRINKLPAVTAKEYLNDPSVGVLFRCVDAKIGELWVNLDDDDLVNQHTQSWEVLVVLEELASKYNFGFLDNWKFRRVPQSGVPSVEPKNMDPFFYSLISGDYATLAQLKTVYSLEDAFALLDALVTERTNEHYAMKAAKGG